MNVFSPSRIVLLCGNLVAVLGAATVLTSASTSNAPIPAGTQMGRSDYAMFGGTIARNMVNMIDKNIPDKVDPEGSTLLWKADLGSRSYGGPTIAGGKVYVGTNNESIVPRNMRDVRRDKDGEIDPIDRGILLCLDESTGKFLWQAVHAKLRSGILNDWPKQGVCSARIVDGDRVYYISNRCTVVCVDVNGQKSEKPAGVERKEFSDPTDARFVWEFDMIKELNVYPHNMSACSPLIVGDLIFVVTANGVDEGHVTIPSPEAPSFIALNKANGKLVWKSNAPGKDIMHGQWSNPTYADINGVPQVIFPGGDGWLRGFVPETGEQIWKFDCNPKDADWQLGGIGTKNDFIATPVIYDGKVYIGVGQDPEHTTGNGNFFCISPTKRGDISKTTISGRDKDGNPLNEKPNPNSCEVWRYGGLEKRIWAQREFKFGRTMSTASIVDDIAYVAELSGYLHCIDAKTGEHYWQFDTKASIWGSPYYVDGKIFLANDQGELYIFKHQKTPKVYDEIKAVAHAQNLKEARRLRLEIQKQVSEEYLLSKVEFDAPIRTTPVVANGRLYVMTEKNLYAFRCGK